MEFEINQVFDSYNEVHDITYTYRYLGVDPTIDDPSYNIALENVETCKIIYVEREWFNQRVISNIR